MWQEGLTEAINIIFAWKCRAKKKKRGNTNTDSLFENTEGRLKTASRDFCFPSVSQIIIKSSFFSVYFLVWSVSVNNKVKGAVGVLSCAVHANVIVCSMIQLWNVLLSVWFTAKENTKQCSLWTPTLHLGTPQPTTSARSGWPNSCYNICLNEKVWSLLCTKCTSDVSVRENMLTNLFCAKTENFTFT